MPRIAVTYYVNQIFSRAQAAGRAFARNTKGATAIEYALIATFIALVIISSAGILGNNVSNTLTNVSTKMG